MSDLGDVAKFAGELYRQRAGTTLAAYVRRDKLALLQRRRFRPARRAGDVAARRLRSTTRNVADRHGP